MSENLQQENIVKNFQDELDSIDEKYQDDTESENCAKCLEKLNIYTRFVADLIDRGLFHNLHGDLDDVSISSTLEETNAKIQYDLNVVRDCLDNRKEIEKHAIDSLSEVEGMVESMLKDYCRVIEENQHLNEELQRGEVNRANFDDFAMLESQNESSNGLQNDDCQIELEKLQQQLAERDGTIEELLDELNRLNVQESNDPNANESSANEHDDLHSPDLLDASQKLKNTIKDLEQLSDETEGILNQNQRQLLEQQAKIDELTKQLEFESNCTIKLKEMEEENQILANQTALLEEQITVLMAERNTLVETNDDLIKSIIACQKELSKYNFE